MSIFISLLVVAVAIAIFGLVAYGRQNSFEPHPWEEECVSDEEAEEEYILERHMEEEEPKGYTVGFKTDSVTFENPEVLSGTWWSCRWEVAAPKCNGTRGCLNSRQYGSLCAACYAVHCER